MSSDTESAGATYVSRPTHIEAVHWTGNNRDEVLRFAPDKTHFDQTRQRMMLLAGKDGAQEWVPVPEGHWLVHPPGDLSDIWPVEDDYFQAKYEVVPFGRAGSS